VEAFDDEAEYPEDDSDGELNLDVDDLNQGDGYDDETLQTTTPLPSSGKVQNGVRIPPPSDQRRTFSSLADELGKPAMEQYTDEVLSEDIGSEKWRESNVRHRAAASAVARNVDC